MTSKTETVADVLAFLSKHVSRERFGSFPAADAQWIALAVQERLLPAIDAAEPSALRKAMRATRTRGGTGMHEIVLMFANEIDANAAAAELTRGDWREPAPLRVPFVPAGWRVDASSDGDPGDGGGAWLRVCEPSGRYAMFGPYDPADDGVGAVIAALAKANATNTPAPRRVEADALLDDTMKLLRDLRSHIGPRRPDNNDDAEMWDLIGNTIYLLDRLRAQPARAEGEVAGFADPRELESLRAGGEHHIALYPLDVNPHARKVPLYTAPPETPASAGGEPVAPSVAQVTSSSTPIPGSTKTFSIITPALSVGTKLYAAPQPANADWKDIAKGLVDHILHDARCPFARGGSGCSCGLQKHIDAYNNAISRTAAIATPESSAPQPASQAVSAEPIPMLLFCPQCGEQHIDAPQPEKGWTNPPHRSHECQFCGHVWRPADVPTNGVASIATKGSRDGNARPRYFYTAKDFDAAVAAATTSRETASAEPIEWLIAQMEEFVSHAPHGDNCYLTDEFPGNQCRCGKESMERALEQWRERISPAATVHEASADWQGIAKGFADHIEHDARCPVANGEWECSCGLQKHVDAYSEAISDDLSPASREAATYEPVLDEIGTPTGYHRDMATGEIVTLPDEYDEDDDVEVTPEEIAADNAAATAQEATSKPVAWRWQSLELHGYSHPTLKKIGRAWIDVETEGMPDADDLLLEAQGTSRIEYAYAAPQPPTEPSIAPKSKGAGGVDDLGELMIKVKDDVSTPRPTDCADIQSGKVKVLARFENGVPAMTVVRRGVENTVALCKCGALVREADQATHACCVGVRETPRERNVLAPDGETVVRSPSMTFYVDIDTPQLRGRLEVFGVPVNGGPVLRGTFTPRAADSMEHAP